MKKTTLLILLMLPFYLMAQQYPVTSISISLPQNPNPKTSNWGIGNSVFSISVTTRPLAGKLDPILEGSRILVQIKKSGSKVCGTYTLGSAPAANFTSLTKIWNGANALGLLGQECTLLPGEYELCVRIYSGPSNTPMSEEKCKAFTIKSSEQEYNKPQNIIPTNNSSLNQQTATAPVIFKWTAVSPNPGTIVNYQLKVWSKLPNQTVAQAINVNQPLIIKDVVGVTQVTIVNLIKPACLTTTSCEFVWQIQATGPNGETYGTNSGKSDFTTFKTGVINTNGPSNIVCNSISTKTYATGDEIGLSDDFIMKLTSNPTGTNDSLSGEGIVRVKWLGIFNVKFKGIKVNGQDKLCSGTVHTKTDPNQVYPVQFLVNATNVNNYGGAWTTSKVREIAQSIKDNQQLKPLIPAANMVDSVLTSQPINMPIGYFKDGDTSTAIGFTELIFRRDYAEFEAIASYNTEKIFKDGSPLSGTDAIAFRGYGITFNNTGLTGVNGAIKLIEPLVVTYANAGTENLKLKFNTESSGHIGNGIVFSASNADFWRYNLDVDMQLPKEWLVPVDPTKTNVNINFQLNIAQWKDYVAEATLPACIIPNAKGIGIKTDLFIAYDHSFITNPTGIVFPAGYSSIGDTTTFFTGFYLKNFKLTLPDELRSYADTSKKIEVTAQHLVIDENGITGKIVAANVLNYPLANVGNLGASIDTVSVTFVGSSLTEGKMKGKITLPLSSTDDAADAIKYQALFASNNSSFVFSLSPSNDIKSKFLGDGKLQINQTSTLNLTLSKVNNKRAINFNIDINGSLYYPSGKIIDPSSSIPLDLDLSCNFQHLGMTYTSGTNDNFSFNPGQWSFASPQKKLSGFAFTITDVKPKIDPVETISEKQYLFKGGVELTAKINIGSENSNIAISGDTKLVLRGAIVSSKYTPPNTVDSTGIQTLVAQVQPPSGLQWNTSTTTAVSMVKDQYGFLTQLKPKYLGVEVKSVHIDVTTPAVKIKGSVEFFKKDIKYGNGFKGNLEAKFTTPSLSIQAGAIFGNTKYIPNNTGNGFKYWMVEAQVGLPPPGIAFLGALAIRGFGAGVYSRMNMTPPTTFNPTQAASSTFGGAVFTPDATVKLGFKAKAIIATTPKEETFNGSAALAAEFNNSGGMNFLRFDGQFYCGAKISEPTKAFGSGQLLIDYNFPTKELSMNVSISINKDPITTPTPANIRLYINGKTNKWYFKAGVPTNPMAVKIINTDVQAYLMFGNDIGYDIPTGFMPKTVQRFNDLNFSLPTFSQNATSDNRIKSGKGFALGIGVHMDKKDDKRIFSANKGKNYIDIKYSIIAGGELNASFLQYENCDGLGNGWRVRVALAGYGSADLDYEYKTQIPLFSSGSGSILKVKAAITGIAEFPNPTYLQGTVAGSYDFVGKTRSIDKDFSIGDQCSGTEQTTNEPAATTQENAIDDLNYSLIKNIVTPGTDNVNRKTDFVVDLNYPYNKTFDVDEQQATGEIKVRTFRANYIVTLTQDSISNQMTKISKATIVTSNNNQSKSSSGSASTSTSNTITLYSKGVDMFGAQKFALNSLSFGNNALKANTSYRFKIVGNLEEKINGSWQVVKKKNSTQNITETKQLYFKTNSESTLSVAGTNNQINNSAPQKIKKL